MMKYEVTTLGWIADLLPSQTVNHRFNVGELDVFEDTETLCWKGHEEPRKNDYDWACGSSNTCRDSE